MRRERKRNRNRLALRDRITFEDLAVILSLTSGPDLKDVRTYVAICLLYITGLRANNLRLFTIRHLIELRRKRKTCIRLIKNGADRYTIQISEGDFKLLSAIQPKLKLLCENKHSSEPLFRGYGTGSYANEPIHRNTMLKSINKVLIQASHKLGKYIRSHSFRVTRISDMLEITNIEVVAKIIGHNSINSTKAYDRVRVDFDYVHKDMDQFRMVKADALDIIL